MLSSTSRLKFNFYRQTTLHYINSCIDVISAVAWMNYVLFSSFPITIGNNWTCCIDWTRTARERDKWSRVPWQEQIATHFNLRTYSTMFILSKFANCSRALKHEKKMHWYTFLGTSAIFGVSFRRLALFLCDCTHCTLHIPNKKK